MKNILLVIGILLIVFCILLSYHIKQLNGIDTKNEIAFFVAGLFLSYFFILKYFEIDIKFRKRFYQIKKRRKNSSLTGNINIPINLQFTVEINDLTEFNNYVILKYSKYYRAGVYWLQVMFVLITISGIYDLIIHYKMFFSNLDYYMLSFTVLIFLFIRFLFLKMFYDEAKLGIFKIGKYSISIKEDGIMRSDERHDFFCSWDSLDCCVSSEKYLYFMFSQYEGIIIPMQNINLENNEKISNILKDSFE